MSVLVLPRHAETRMRQRGFRHCDLHLYFLCASETGPHVYFLGRKDAKREIRQRLRDIQRLERRAGHLAGMVRADEIRRLKREIQALERLRGWKLVVGNDNTVKTCYRPNRGNQKRTLRRGREFR